MKKLVSTFGFLLLINTCLISQVSIDFCPKTLKSELKKLSNGIAIEMQELPMYEDQTSTFCMGKFFSIPNLIASANVKYVYVGRVNTCRTGGCTLPSNNSNQTKEFLDYYILYSANAQIQKIKIFNYQSTHGQEVTAASWLKQFRNYNGKETLIVGKNIDALSGATISADATTFDIEDKTKLLQKLLQKLAHK